MGVIFLIAVVYLVGVAFTSDKASRYPQTSKLLIWSSWLGYFALSNAENKIK